MVGQEPFQRVLYRAEHIGPCWSVGSPEMASSLEPAIATGNGRSNLRQARHGCERLFGMEDTVWIKRRNRKCKKRGQSIETLRRVVGCRNSNAEHCTLGYLMPPWWESLADRQNRALLLSIVPWLFALPLDVGGDFIASVQLGPSYGLVTGCQEFSQGTAVGSNFRNRTPTTARTGMLQLVSTNWDGSGAPCGSANQMI